MPSHPQPPVPWQELKRLQDEHNPRGLGCRQLTGLLLVGGSGTAACIAIWLALDPTETVEPFRYLFYALLTFAAITGWVGGSLLGKDGPARKDEP